MNHRESYRVTILHTNDMHSRLEAMSRLSTYARQLRRQLEAEGRQVFFFDAGDAEDRRERFISVTKGAVFPRIMTAMGYTLTTIGNSISVTYGPQAISEMASRAEVPLLAANLYKGKRPLTRGIHPSAILRVGRKIQLGVIGLTVHTPDIYALFGLQVPDFRDAAQAQFETFLRKDVRAVVVLSHLGLRLDRELAEAIPKIDVIIGGHSHTLLPEGEWVNGVLISQAGSFAERLGRVDLTLHPETGEVLEKLASVIEIPTDTPLDPLVELAIATAEEESQQLLAKRVASLSEALSLDYYNECGIVDLAADALCERMAADASLLTSGLFHRGLPAGEITLGDLDAACFSTANPYLSLVSGEQIFAALERGLDPALAERLLPVFRGAPVGIPAVSKMTVVYDPNAETGLRVKRVTIRGKPLDPQRRYRLAHTDAELISDVHQAGFIQTDPEQVLKVEVPTILREVLEDFLRAHSPTPHPDGRRMIRLSSPA